MSHEKTELSTFCLGIGLYAYQASQSLDRALGSDLEGLRKFYVGRTQPAQLARATLNIDPSRCEANAGLLRRLIFGKTIKTIDLWLMSRLLYDFNSVLHGKKFEIEDLGCLRYCLSASSSRFVHGPVVMEMGKLIHYGRNDCLGAGIEIDDVLGNRWSQL